MLLNDEVVVNHEPLIECSISRQNGRVVRGEQGAGPFADKAFQGESLGNAGKGDHPDSIQRDDLQQVFRLAFHQFKQAFEPVAVRLFWRLDGRLN